MLSLPCLEHGEGIATRMKKTILLYGLCLAVVAFALEWLEYRYFMRVFSTEIYIVILVTGFTGLGIWVGQQLTPQQPAYPFTVNTAALKALGVSPREYTVLELMAAGQSNKEIARSLDISPNTVKTHIARVFEKLGAARRTEAINKARELSLIR